MIDDKSQLCGNSLFEDFHHTRSDMFCTLEALQKREGGRNKDTLL